MKKRFLPGRGLCALSALMLLLIAACELVIRLDAMYKPIRMFFELASGEGIPLSTAMEYFDFTIFHQPLYLTGCIVLGIIGLIFCRRPLLFLFSAPACVLIGVCGYRLEATELLNGWRIIRLIPLLGLSIGSVLNLTGLIPRRRAPEPAQPRLNDAPKLHAISHDSSEKARRSA